MGFLGCGFGCKGFLGRGFGSEGFLWRGNGCGPGFRLFQVLRGFQGGSGRPFLLFEDFPLHLADFLPSPPLQSVFVLTGVHIIFLLVLRPFVHGCWFWPRCRSRSWSWHQRGFIPFWLRGWSPFIVGSLRRRAGSLVFPSPPSHNLRPTLLSHRTSRFRVSWVFGAGGTRCGTGRPWCWRCWLCRHGRYCGFGGVLRTLSGEVSLLLTAIAMWPSAFDHNCH